MKVKKYEAPTLQEALLNVKKDLGSEAVILQTRKFTRGGMLGLFGKQMVEVLAALDVPASKDEQAPSPRKRPVAESAPSTAAATYKRTSPAPATPGAAPGSSIDTLREEMREVRNVIKSLVTQNTTTKAVEASSPFPPSFGDIYLQLLENDVDSAVAQEIIRSLNEAMPDEDKDSSAAVREYLSRHLKRLIKVTGGIELTPGSPKTVALIGPTGVGKTTTIAKLAAQFSLSRRKKVGLITADTYRIAAVEQLKVYGEILDIPVKVVYDSDDMKHSLDLFSDRDLILIDTAGRSHRNTDKLYSLKEILSTHFPIEISLVLNPGTRFKEICDIAEKFRILPYSSFIFTKLDEASTYGNMLNAITKFNTGVSYVAYGQNVPEELKPAAYDMLIDLTLGRPLEKSMAVTLA